MAAKTKLPEKVLIGYREFEIIESNFTRNLPTDSHACIDNDNEIIAYRKGYSGKRTAEILLHEVIHGLCYETGMFEDDRQPTEEQMVFTLARALCSFWLHNPQFAKWFNEQFKEGD